MSEKENDREELEFLVDKLELDSRNAELEKSEDRLRETGANLKNAPTSKQRR